MPSDQIIWLLAIVVVLTLTVAVACLFLLFRKSNIENREQAFTETISQRLTENFMETSNHFHGIQQSIGKILESQRGIHDLSKGMETLNNIMTNKQSRGKFGETQLQDIVSDSLPRKFYDFQVTLTNTQLGSSTRVDCLLRMPDPAGQIAVDSKFPLEGFLAYQSAEDDQSRTVARKELFNSVRTHLKEISEKYIIEGLTADCALMFLPSEAVYSMLHSEIPELIQESQRLRVYIVSPSTMMATVVTVRSIFRDVEIRKHAEELRKHLRVIGENVVRFNKRLTDLGKHFDLTQRDLNNLQISGKKIVDSIEKVNNMDSQHLVEQSSSASTSLVN